MLKREHQQPPCTYMDADILLLAFSRGINTRRLLLLQVLHYNTSCNKNCYSTVLIVIFQIYMFNIWLRKVYKRILESEYMYTRGRKQRSSLLCECRETPREFLEHRNSKLRKWLQMELKQSGRQLDPRYAILHNYP